MTGRFITHMASHSRQACNPKRDRLTQSTADGFCSSVKVFFTAKFRNEADIPAFQKQQWAKLREKFKGLHRESDRAKGKPNETEEVSSTRQDREAVAAACIWIGSPEFSEFWHLLNASCHCSGRGSEVSLIKSEEKHLKKLFRSGATEELVKARIGALLEDATDEESELNDETSVEHDESTHSVRSSVTPRSKAPRSDKKKRSTMTTPSRSG